MISSFRYKLCFLMTIGAVWFSAQAADDVEVTISPQVEQAVGKGLAFLATTQNADGSWSGRYGKNVGETSLCIMAFMSMGNLPGEGKYGHIAAKGLNWIIKQAKPSGLIEHDQSGREAPVMYGHALSTLMLSEVWGQTRRQDVGEVLRKAVTLITQVQGPQGGWNYKSIPRDGDTSVCVMQMFALKSAYEAGIYIPGGTIQKALTLIKKRYDKGKRMFGYRNSSANPSQVGSSAAGVCIMHIVGEEAPEYTTTPRAKLIDVMKGDKQSHFYYFTYYGSVSCYYGGGDEYREWKKAMEAKVLKKQRSNGSWGNHYESAFAILALALPYRYIPIYQH